MKADKWRRDSKGIPKTEVAIEKNSEDRIQEPEVRIELEIIEVIGLDSLALCSLLLTICSLLPAGLRQLGIELKSAPGVWYKPNLSKIGSWLFCSVKNG
ncbi:MAG TPA: hypothetical protein VEZ90_10565 [Blastocatellia bacterium]|nr:hypothetical protein [Blastocatellia bacterium]